MKSPPSGATLLALLLAACSAPVPPAGSDAAATAGTPTAASPDTSSDRDTAAILAYLHATWDRPEARLDAGPVVMQGDYAVADWTQGDKGGRALLRRVDGAWTTWLCAGDGIRDAAGLRKVGVPDADANALARQLAAAERGVPADRMAKMATFAGIVRMDAQAHATHAGHGQPHGEAH